MTSSRRGGWAGGRTTPEVPLLSTSDLFFGGEKTVKRANGLAWGALWPFDDVVRALPPLPDECGGRGRNS